MLFCSRKVASADSQPLCSGRTGLVGIKCKEHAQAASPEAPLSSSCLWVGGFTGLAVFSRAAPSVAICAGPRGSNNCCHVAVMVERRELVKFLCSCLLWCALFPGPALRSSSASSSLPSRSSGPPQSWLTDEPERGLRSPWGVSLSRP